MGRGKLLDDPVGVAEGIDPHDDDPADRGDAVFDGQTSGSIAEADLSEAEETGLRPADRDETEDPNSPDDAAGPGGIPAGEIGEDAPAAGGSRSLL